MGYAVLLETVPADEMAKLARVVEPGRSELEGGTHVSAEGI